jgi:hypothetical protein
LLELRLVHDLMYATLQPVNHIRVRTHRCENPLPGLRINLRISSLGQRGNIR